MDDDSSDQSDVNEQRITAYSNVDTVSPIAVDDFVDAESGSGSLSETDDWVRANSSPEANDGRSPTNTYFDPKDVSGRYPDWQKDRKKRNKRSWQTMANWQDGVQSDISRGAQNWWADKQRWVDVFTDMLHGTDRHKQQCKEALTEIDMQPYQSAGISTEILIVGILSLLIDSDVTEFENRVLARDNTKDLIVDLESSVSEYESVRSKLRQNDKELLFPNKSGGL